MIIKSTNTTERMEKIAKRMFGREIGIIRSDENRSGRYFVVSIDGEAQRAWISLGWTFKDAIERLKEHEF